MKAIPFKVIMSKTVLGSYTMSFSFMDKGSYSMKLTIHHLHLVL